MTRGVRGVAHGVGACGQRMGSAHSLPRTAAGSHPVGHGTRPPLQVARWPFAVWVRHRETWVLLQVASTQLQHPQPAGCARHHHHHHCQRTQSETSGCSGVGSCGQGAKPEQCNDTHPRTTHPPAVCMCSMALTRVMGSFSFMVHEPGHLRARCMAQGQAGRQAHGWVHSLNRSCLLPCAAAVGAVEADPRDSEGMEVSI